MAHYKGDVKGKTFALWGLAFKPDTDDIREAPALYMIDELLAQGAKIQAFDPEAMENVKALYGDKVSFVSSATKATENADALLIATEWTTFRSPDFDMLKDNLKDDVIFDGRNLYDTNTVRDKGLTYYSIGRETV